MSPTDPYPIITRIFGAGQGSVTGEGPAPVVLSGQSGSLASLFVSLIDAKVLVFYDTEEEALLMSEELEYFLGREVYLFPGYEERVFEREQETKRAAFLFHLAFSERFAGLFPADSLGHALPPPEPIAESTKTIRPGQTLFQEDLLEYLEKGGYEQTSLVRDKGEYAKRGSIVDIFPPAETDPVRLEYLGDEILSIRSFQASSQRSRSEIREVSLTPVAMVRDERATILDYLADDVTLVHRGEEHLARRVDPEGPQGERLKAVLGKNLCIDTSGIIRDEGSLVLNVQSNQDLRHLFETRKSEVFPVLSRKLRDEWLHCRYIYLFAHTRQQAERLREIFATYGVSLPLLAGISAAEKDREWGIVTGPLRRGFRTANLIVLTEEDIAGPKKRVVRRRAEGFDAFLQSFRDLKEGEYVVHIDHGIGLFRGIKELTVGGHRKDYVLLEYQDGDRLYVPIENLHLVQKYVAGDKHTPKIDRLGSQLWKNTKRRVRKQVEDIAGELISIYAERQAQEGYPYPPEDELYREMESRFEFEETDGQMKAITDVLEDLKSPRPMDRLICGDVGFGKTEVAMRAAFKVVEENKQVVILVPTTILAQQHFKNFSERFRDYPVTIEVLSRFRTKKEQSEVAEGLRRGSVDIVIGTHRLFQKDLSLRDFGLLIVDEEHRFGVRHKEKLKLLKKNVDVLTLTATPIPRTLHMATTGIRDLSIINTPPLDRLAVKTTVVRFGDQVIRQGIARELERGGQVFFMHNFIHNIGAVYDHLSGLLPGVKIGIAHGQMEGKALEKVMLEFIEGKYNILLSTNIIESGLDISNVNTIFINNAHRLGLADLYQLRGRVGRGTRQAYAYLLVPRKEVLTREASLRLKIIEELTELGSGFHVASYDMEIRGAGNLLGSEQSGNINLVGFELYCSMLEEAVRAMRDTGSAETEEVVPEINLPIDAYIPDSYIAETTHKLLTYKRLARIRGEEELEDMREELRDRFGDIPPPLENLFRVISLKILLARRHVKKVEHAGRQVVVHVTEKTPIDMTKLLRTVGNRDGGVKLLPDRKIVITHGADAGELVDFTTKWLMELLPL